MSGRYFIALPGGKVQEAELLKWAQWFETAGTVPFQDGGRIVAKTEVDWFEVFKAGGPLPAKAEPILVSTVFLGLDHALHGGPPILFETMIFGGPHNDYQARYRTVEEAIAGHKTAVAKAQQETPPMPTVKEDADRIDQAREVPSGLVEVCRSFSYKLNAGGYESRDFFCSQKAECRAEDAEAVSARLHEFCRKDVMKAVAEYKAMVAGPQH